jgi:diacylglycerol kinase family enzyme
MLELERVDGKFNISGNLYDDDEAERIANFIFDILQDEHISRQALEEYRAKFGGEHIESQVDKDMRSSQQAEIDKEVGEWEYKSKFGDEGDY